MGFKRRRRLVLGAHFGPFSILMDSLNYITISVLCCAPFHSVKLMRSHKMVNRGFSFKIHEDTVCLTAHSSQTSSGQECLPSHISGHTKNMTE